MSDTNLTVLAEYIEAMAAAATAAPGPGDPDANYRPQRRTRIR